MRWATFQEDLESRRANGRHARNSNQATVRYAPQNSSLKVDGENK
jgi:hypothetical protein